jgi:hypothetical protein
MTLSGSTDNPTQFDIFGGEVKHPPPKPRERCRECNNLITLNRDGTLHKHNIYAGQVCPRSGLRHDATG